MNTWNRVRTLAILGIGMLVGGGLAAAWGDRGKAAAAPAGNQPSGAGAVPGQLHANLTRCAGGRRGRDGAGSGAKTTR